MSNSSLFQSARFNRRSFLAMAAAAAGAHSLAAAPAGGPRLAFLSATDPAGRIESYAIHGGAWSLRHSVSAQAPVSLAVHRSGNSLYALHDVQEFQGLPRGYVESYRVDPISARLTLLAQQPLSLSATGPRHITITPDGKNLIASIHGGGAYNLLPVLADGSAGRVRAIRKATGHGLCAINQSSAHPQAVVYDRVGRHFIAADLGADSLSILEPDSLSVLSRRDLAPGSGPRYLALHPSRRFVFAACALSGALLSVEYSHQAAQLGAVRHSLPGSFGGPLAVHPNGHILYAACEEGLAALRIDESNGAFHPAGYAQIPSGVTALAISPAGDKLFAATPKNVLSIKIGFTGGHFGQYEVVADSPGVRSILLI